MRLSIWARFIKISGKRKNRTDLVVLSTMISGFFCESAFKIDPTPSVLYSVSNRAEGGLRGDAYRGDHSQDPLIGSYTLGQAREASQKTYYARITY